MKPESGKHEEIIVHAEEVKVQGRVIWSSQKFKTEQRTASFVLLIINEGADMNMPRNGVSPRDDREGLDLTPPEGGYELYRHKDAQDMKTKGWHGYYWARKNEAGDYEIRSVPASEGEPSMPGGVFPKEGFEEHYERAHI